MRQSARLRVADNGTVALALSDKRAGETAEETRFARQLTPLSALFEGFRGVGSAMGAL